MKLLHVIKQQAQMNELLLQTRRHFFSECSISIGSMALASLIAGDKRSHASDAALNPMAPKPPHFTPRAKNVIYLFMAGGPSQLELFDYKPKLQELNGQPIPESYVAGKRFAFMNTSNGMNLLGTRKTFQQHGASGAWLSDGLPYLGAVADNLCFVKTCKTDLFNHAPAKLFMNTGSGQSGRPSLGSWMTYGLGSECSDLPGFVVLQSGPRGPRGGAPLWGSGMLPSRFQGVPLRNQEEPIVNLTTPGVVNQAEQRKVIDMVVELNRQRLLETGDDEIATRINAYEMAYRMQSSAPELMNTTDEDAATLALYGIAEAKEASFARNCLLARRLVQRGVRFIQLYHTNWDSHGGVGETLEDDFPKVVKQVDQPCAALIKDLKRLGLLEDTLVIWGGEFGRTPMGENREKSGRNHHIDAFTMWFAGGGMKAGMTYGETDELGFGAATNPVHVRDIHATILNQLGLSHERLSVRAQGLDYRLTGVLPARVVTEILA